MQIGNFKISNLQFPISNDLIINELASILQPLTQHNQLRVPNC
jgi:hypothetical protein